MTATTDATVAVQDYLADRRLPRADGAYKPHPPCEVRDYADVRFLRRPRSGADGSGNRLSELLALSNGLLRHRFMTAQGARMLLPGGGAGWDVDDRLLTTILLRPVPSGGAAYPVDLWVLSADDPDLSDGVYRYDPLHHALERRVHTDPRPRLARALGGPVPDLALVLSVRLERTTPRYGAFAHRLHLLDAGHTVAQILVAARYLGLAAGARLAFADDEIEHLLQLGDDMETCLAVVTLGEVIRRPEPIGPAPARRVPAPPGYPVDVLHAVRRAAAGAEPGLGVVPSPDDAGTAMRRRRSPSSGFAGPAPPAELLEPAARAAAEVLEPLGGRCLLLPPGDRRALRHLGAPGSRIDFTVAGLLVPVLDLPGLVDRHGPAALRVALVAVGAALQAAALQAGATTTRELAAYPLCAYDGPGLEQALDLPPGSTACIAAIGSPRRAGLDLELAL